MIFQMNQKDSCGSAANMDGPFLSLPGNCDLVQRLQPMRVMQVLRLSSGYTYPICPACRVTLEREYQRYCDRCGQCLNWKGYDKAIIIQWSKEYGYTKLCDISVEWHRICN